MASKAVSNSGPLIHLSEIGKLIAMRLWTILIPPEVAAEIGKLPIVKLENYKFIKQQALSATSKDFSKKLAIKFELDLGESEAIALANQEKINLFFTDDLDARAAAKILGLEVHGTVGILLRAFRNNIFSKQETLAALENLKQSSLYVTTDLINLAKSEVEKFNV